MQEAQHPNKLRILLTIAGLTQREAAHESGIPEGTLRHYITGGQVIPRRDRIKLAQVIGCDIQDLAPQYNAKIDMPKKLGLRHRMTVDKKPLPALESNGFFLGPSTILDEFGLKIGEIGGRVSAKARLLAATLLTKRDLGA
jgi:transcriptional regulator with XRE-family HTH domain